MRDPEDRLKQCDEPAVQRLENGSLAITVEGVNRANSEHHRRTTSKLLTDQNSAGMEFSEGTLGIVTPPTIMNRSVNGL
ncbi:MAG: hypothetical protein WCB22_23725 [Pseudolabrys sp.]